MMDEIRELARDVRTTARRSSLHSPDQPAEEIVRRPTTVPDELWVLLRQLDSETAS
jgi:hypothetical protein